MDRIKKITHKGKEIIHIDYSDCRGEDMIAVAAKVTELIIAENKEVLLFSIFNKKNYITPSVMKQLESGLKLIECLTKKNAVTGLSRPQLWILKGVNLWIKKKIYPFESTEQALDFLAE